MSREGFIAGCGKGFQAGFYYRDGDVGDVGDDRRKGMGFISHHEVEWRLVGDGMRSVIMCEFGVRNRFGPRCGIIATEDLKIHKFPLPGLLIPFHRQFVGGRR